ncbi:MAG: nitroreductase [Pseudomonadota bacterium]
MKRQFPLPPRTGTAMPATQASETARTFLALRRSTGKANLTEPGPSQDEVNELIDVAARIPDHRRVGPWRFIVFEGDARTAFGANAADIQRREQDDVKDEEIELTKALLMRAPSVVAVISSPDHSHKTPVWEQELSAGAVCYNLLLAANASGWAGCWLSEWISYSPGIDAMLGLSAHERIAGFIYLGTAAHDPQERLRPDIPERIARWTPD